MGRSGSLLIFRVIGQRSRSNFNLDYISVNGNLVTTVQASFLDQS